MFAINLRLTWSEATGKPPAATANPVEKKPGSFARFVTECLKRAGAPDADAVETINTLARARKRDRWIEIEAQTKLKCACQASTPKRHAEKYA
jgi:hypothetical protein